MKSRSASWLLLCVALVAFGCAKGDTGPTGPKGATGSANVIYSDWYSPATWAAETLFGIAQRTYTMTATSLTQEIIDRGVVQVYMRFVGLNPAIVQLPFTANDVGYSFYLRAAAGSIKVSYYRPRGPDDDSAHYTKHESDPLRSDPRRSAGRLDASQWFVIRAGNRRVEVHVVLGGVPQVQYPRMS